MLAVRPWSSGRAYPPSGDQRLCPRSSVLVWDGFMTHRGEVPESVADLVTVDLVAVLPHDRVGRARDILLTFGIHALPVMEGNDVLGIVTSADLVEEWPDDELVSTVMTPAPTTIAVEASIAEAAELMVSHRIHHLLVTDSIEVMGIVSSLDLLQALVGTASSSR